MSGYEGLKKSNCAALAVSIDYGDWLNVAYELHYNTQAGLRTDSWKEWLKTNVGIGDSYARKLRTISDVFGKSPGFRKLGLSVSEVYGNTRAIKSLLTIDAGAAAYWRTAR